VADYGKVAQNRALRLQYVEQSEHHDRTDDQKAVVSGRPEITHRDDAGDRHRGRRDEDHPCRETAPRDPPDADDRKRAHHQKRKERRRPFETERAQAREEDDVQGNQNRIHFRFPHTRSMRRQRLAHPNLRDDDPEFSFLRAILARQGGADADRG
jgi:hypothetical protein